MIKRLTVSQVNLDGYDTKVELYECERNGWGGVAGGGAISTLTHLSITRLPLSNNAIFIVKPYFC